MVFSSLLFLYIFLPVNLLCYAALSDIRKKNICLLVSSLIFYAWASPRYLLVMLLMVLINYIGALGVESFRNTRMAHYVLVADIALSMGILGYFKYLGFICGISKFIVGVPKVIPQIVLPVGISFYTFQLVSYVVDVYRREVRANRSYWGVLLYASLFHQCIAGPIVRYKDVERELKRRKTGIEDINEGISRFTIGLAKKTLLANSCASIVDSVLPESIAQLGTVTVLGSWFGMLMYALEIYLDFSAYSDMAIGLGRIAGFHYKENFNYPYVSDSITDFWRRWHISLGTFFRDYLYIPLGGNRKGLKRQIFNMFIVWSLTGLWHGASANFILWGMYFFVFLALEKAVLLSRFDSMPAVAGWITRRLYTFIIVLFGWVLFRFSDFSMLGTCLKAMFGLNGNSFTDTETNTMIANNIYFVIAAVIASMPLCRNITQKMRKAAVSGGIAVTYCYSAINAALPVVLLILSTIALVGNSYNPFIYFRF